MVYGEECVDGSITCDDFGCSLQIATTLDTELAFFNDSTGLNRFCRRLRECV